MAPFTDHDSLLGKRYYCSDREYQLGYCSRSTWGEYGRWVFAAIVVVFFIFVFFILACITSRRRRRRGMQPMYGTGWMAGNGAGNYQNNPQAYAQPPPAYGAQNQSYPMNNYQQNGYYSGQNEGVQAPKNVYPHDSNANNNATYAPPEGPPPNK